MGTNSCYKDIFEKFNYTLLKFVILILDIFIYVPIVIQYILFYNNMILLLLLLLLLTFILSISKISYSRRILRFINYYIKVPNKIGLFISGTPASLVVKNGTKKTF